MPSKAGAVVTRVTLRESFELFQSPNPPATFACGEALARMVAILDRHDFFALRARYEPTPEEAPNDGGGCHIHVNLAGGEERDVYLDNVGESRACAIFVDAYREGLARHDPFCSPCMRALSAALPEGR